MKRVALAGLCLILIYGVLRAAATVADVFLFGFASVLVAMVFSIPANWLSRWVSRGWAVVLSLAMLLGIFAVVVLLTVPIISRQASQLFTQLPKALLNLDRWVSHAGSQSPFPQFSQSIQQQLSGTFTRILPKTLPVALNAVSVVGGFFLLIILGAFFAHRPTGYQDAVRTLVPRRAEPMMDEAWNRLGTGLRHWVSGIIVSMAIMGSLTAVGLWIAGIQGWFTLGFLTCLGSFVPYAGALLSAIPGLLIGISQSETKFLAALLVYACVHLTEGYLVQPFIMKKAVRLRPALLLFWQLLMMGLFGIPGIIVATPLLVALKVLVGYFYIERRLGKVGPEP